ncbi:hypothetical protein E2C01_069602 [Portunus trituberculatus]|uniref:Uncharacterized protein n=1 Tax=Portunus trituberculatus TaxID=210409 RepID=A0A5B7I2S4_PORTR|nr:hypothetical protein [Portunus trituberculatus]
MLTEASFKTCVAVQLFVCATCSPHSSFVTEWDEEKPLGAERLLPLTIVDCLWPQGSGHYLYEVDQPPWGGWGNHSTANSHLKAVPSRE